MQGRIRSFLLELLGVLFIAIWLAGPWIMFAALVEW
jgi:hypothetical protein